MWFWYHLHLVFNSVSYLVSIFDTMKVAAFVQIVYASLAALFTANSIHFRFSFSEAVGNSLQTWFSVSILDNKNQVFETVWRIKLYPKGCDQEHANYVSIAQKWWLLHEWENPTKILPKKAMLASLQRRPLCNVLQGIRPSKGVQVFWQNM